MNKTKLLAIASLFGGLAVIIGAFGAHGLQKFLSHHELEVFQTGVKYHFYHVFALFIYLIWAKDKILSLLPAYFFISGILIFSGSLYLLAVIHMPKLGMITPIGGLLFILGWFTFTYQILNYKPEK